MVETNDGEEIDFEVVGIIEDDAGKAYAICYSAKLDHEEEEGAQPFIVTDACGQLVRDPVLAQAILDDFLVLAAEEETSLDGQHDHEEGDECCDHDHDHDQPHPAEGN